MQATLLLLVILAAPSADGDTLQSAAEHCSAVALTRFAVSSTDPAAEVAEASFQACSNEWNLVIGQLAARLEADPARQDANRIHEHFTGEKPDPLLSVRVATEVTHDVWIKQAKTFVFIVRARAHEAK